MFSRKPARFIVAGLAVAAIAGGTYGILNATSSSSPAASAATAPAAFRGAGGGGSNARSGPAAGGSIGVVNDISASGFTLATSAGQKVVEETSSTAYKYGAKSAAASAVKTGETALVIGTVDSATITASQVILQASAGPSTTASTVVPFTRGTASTAKSVGQIPANYQQGSGTIVGGVTASKATQAALAAYPGGIVDRVVRLSNGAYEVHNLGVNWPHHIFVNQNFKVVGAD